MRVAAVILALLILALPARATAQQPGGVGGFVRDTAGQPVPDALVSVTGHAAEARTDSAGRFTLRGVAPGRHVLSARRVGYTAGSVALTVRPDATTEVDEVVLTRLVGMLDTIVTTAPAECPPLGLDGFWCRRRSSRGFFLDNDEIAKRNVNYPAMLLSNHPGFRIRAGYGGRPFRLESTRGWRCIVQLVDGRRPSRARPLPVFAHEILAMEVYEVAADIPLELQRYMWSNPRGGGEPCALINYWTR